MAREQPDEIVEAVEAVSDAATATSAAAEVSETVEKEGKDHEATESKGKKRRKVVVRQEWKDWLLKSVKCMKMLHGWTRLKTVQWAKERTPEVFGHVNSATVTLWVHSKRHEGAGCQEALSRGEGACNRPDRPRRAGEVSREEGCDELTAVQGAFHQKVEGLGHRGLSELEVGALVLIDAGSRWKRREPNDAEKQLGGGSGRERSIIQEKSAVVADDFAEDLGPAPRVPAATLGTSEKSARERLYWLRQPPSRHF